MLTESISEMRWREIKCSWTTVIAPTQPLSSFLPVGIWSHTQLHSGHLLTYKYIEQLLLPQPPLSLLSSFLLVGIWSHTTILTTPSSRHLVAYNCNEQLLLHSLPPPSPYSMNYVTFVCALNWIIISHGRRSSSSGGGGGPHEVFDLITDNSANVTLASYNTRQTLHNWLW